MRHLQDAIPRFGIDATSRVKGAIDGADRDAQSLRNVLDPNRASIDAPSALPV
jgi:hypothetical protein